MRDDIHKSAPVNTAWRKFLGRCVREADRGDRAIESADRALAGDCTREISPELLKTVLARCASPETDLFASKLGGLEALGGHVMAQHFIDRLRQTERRGALDSSTVERTLGEVIADRAQSQQRAMVGHVLKDGGRGSGDCIRAIKHSVSSLSPVALARDLIANVGRLTRTVKATGVNLNENLL